MSTIEMLVFTAVLWLAALLGVRHRKYIQGRPFSRWDYVMALVGAILVEMLLGWLVSP